MAIEHHFYMDVSASRHELRDGLARARIGLDALADFEYISHNGSEATIVSIIERDDPDRPSIVRFRPDNGVFATRSICFRDRRAAEGDEFDIETVLGVMALLKAFPQADAFWEAYDARRPILLRRDGRLILAKGQTVKGEQWDAEGHPYLALVDLPYVFEPLGPWADVPVETRMEPR